MFLSIIVPVFNEESTIKTVVDKLLKLRLSKIKKEIIVVDDGSTDKTSQIVTQYQKKKKIQAIIHKGNMGKGSAIRSGLKMAKGDYVLFQDADLEYDPDDIPRLLSPVLKGRAEVVYGSRFTGERKNMFFWHAIANKTLSLLVDILFDTTISDVEVGYKLIKKNILDSFNITSKSFDLEIELTTKILKKKIKIYEVPISYNGRDYNEGKKITPKDGLIAFLKIFYYRFID